VQLYVPRLLNRSSWLRWVYENTTELTRSPLLFQSCESGVRVDQQSLAVIARSPLLLAACERVARILAEERSRYLPVPIDIGMTTCTDCCEPMLDRDSGASAMVCPRCKGRSATSVGEQRPETVFVDYRPLDTGLVRTVIGYLHGLAENSKIARGEWAFTARSAPELITADARIFDPLWDRELDGDSRGFTPRE
jgi:hypothetical protein